MVLKGRKFVQFDQSYGEIQYGVLSSQCETVSLYVLHQNTLSIVALGNVYIRTTIKIDYNAAGNYAGSSYGTLYHLAKKALVFLFMVDKLALQRF